MSKRKKIESLDWQDRLQSLTSGNRGRTAAIAAEGMTWWRVNLLKMCFMIRWIKVMI
jgi:hypothetical protein